MTNKFQSLLFCPNNIDVPKTDTTTPKINTCIIYSLWSNPLYLPLLKLSIFSQLRYTDANLTDIKIFTDKKLYEQTVKSLSNFPVEIIRVEKIFRKYSVVNYDILNQYEYVIICDCDTFFYSKNIINLYQNLSSQKNIIMLEDDPAMKVFLDRKCLSVFSQATNDEYIFWFKNNLDESIIEIINKSPCWYLSCLMGFPSSVFNTDQWSSYCQKALEMSYLNKKLPHGCDETIFLTYLWKHNKIISNLELADLDIKTIYGYRIGTFLDNPEFSNHSLYLLHPLHGTYAADPRVEKIFNQVIYMEQAPSLLGSFSL